MEGDRCIVIRFPRAASPMQGARKRLQIQNRGGECVEKLEPLPTKWYSCHAKRWQFFEKVQGITLRSNNSTFG